MKADIKVITNAAKNMVKLDNGQIKVYITAVPEKGRANKEVVKTLADYYQVKKSDIRIIKGQRSRNKTVEVRE